MEPEEGAVVAVVEPEDVRGHPGSATATMWIKIVSDFDMVKICCAQRIYLS